MFVLLFECSLRKLKVATFHFNFVVIRFQFSSFLCVMRKLKKQYMNSEWQIYSKPQDLLSSALMFKSKQRNQLKCSTKGIFIAMVISSNSTNRKCPHLSLHNAVYTYTIYTFSAFRVAFVV